MSFGALIVEREDGSRNLSFSSMRGGVDLHSQPRYRVRASIPDIECAAGGGAAGAEAGVCSNVAHRAGKSTGRHLRERRATRERRVLRQEDSPFWIQLPGSRGIQLSNMAGFLDTQQAVGRRVEVDLSADLQELPA